MIHATADLYASTISCVPLTIRAGQVAGLGRVCFVLRSLLQGWGPQGRARWGREGQKRRELPVPAVRQQKHCWHAD